MAVAVAVAVAVMVAEDTEGEVVHVRMGAIATGEAQADGMFNF